MINVLTSFKPGELAMAKSILDGEDIPYLADGEEFSIAQGGGTLPVRLLVPQEDATRAKELINEMTENRTQPPAASVREARSGGVNHDKLRGGHRAG